MNWSPHLRSLERMITLLAILAFMAGGAFLFVFYFAGPNLEYGFLTVRHRPHAPAPVTFPEELPKAQPSGSVNPTSIKSYPNEEKNRGQSARFPAAAIALRPSPNWFHDVPDPVSPNEPEVLANSLDLEVPQNKFLAPAGWPRVGFSLMGRPQPVLPSIGADSALAVAKPLSPRLKKRGVEDRPEVNEPTEKDEPE